MHLDSTSILLHCFTLVTPVSPAVSLFVAQAQRDELATLARSRPLMEVGGSAMVHRDTGTMGLDRVSEMDARAQEDSLRHMHVLAPTRGGLREAYSYRYGT